MGAIISNFPALPKQGDPDCVATYQLVFGQLGAMGLAVLPTTADKTTRQDLLTLLQNHAGQLIKAEVTKDPLKLGYAGKADLEICALIQAAPDARLSTIWAGLPFTPNYVVELDITGALL